MLPPPKFRQPLPALIQGFAAPMFDPRFHAEGPYREHTVLGLMVEAYARGLRHPNELSHAGVKLMWTELEVLMSECFEDVKKEIDDAR